MFWPGGGERNQSGGWSRGAGFHADEHLKAATRIGTTLIAIDTIESPSRVLTGERASGLVHAQSMQEGLATIMPALYPRQAGLAPGPQKRRPRPLLSQGRGDTMVVRQFVLRACALIRGAPVRRHPAKLSLERLGSASAQLWDSRPTFLRPRG